MGDLGKKVSCLGCSAPMKGGAFASMFCRDCRLELGADVHGKRSRYVKGCRCQRCRDAEADYRYYYRLDRKSKSGRAS